MDRITAILLGLTVFTLSLGFVMEGGEIKFRSAKARCLLSLAHVKADRSRQAAIEFRHDEAERLLEGAVELLRRVESHAEADLDADATIEAVSRTMVETAATLRVHAEATVRKMESLRGETLRLATRLETLRPNTGGFHDSGPATA
jgi:hypothetical protein